jgi:hypothetical protein
MMRKRLALYEAFDVEYMAALYASELESDGYEVRIDYTTLPGRWVVEAWEPRDASQE